MITRLCLLLTPIASVCCAKQQELTPATDYLVCVRALNAAGWGPLSHEVEMQTRPDVPQDPTPPISMSATCVSLELKWDAPINNNGATI